MYMLTAFFISFLLILVDNSLVDDNVGNQSHYTEKSSVPVGASVSGAIHGFCAQKYRQRLHQFLSDH